MDSKKQKTGIVMCSVMMLFCLIGAVVVFFYSVAGYNLVTFITKNDNIIFLAMGMFCYLAFLLSLLGFFKMLHLTINYAKGKVDPGKTDKRLKSFGAIMIVNTILEAISYVSLVIGYQEGIVYGKPSNDYLVQLAVHATVCTVMFLIFMIVTLIFKHKMKKENLALPKAQEESAPQPNEEAGK